MTFELDPRLANDCYKLAESEHSIWLLLNNRFFPWFIIVPKTSCTEFYQLTQEQQAQLQSEINLLSEFVDSNYKCDKLNVAIIGNIVKQMHTHIIARTEQDPCWPGVVWGTNHKQAYEIKEVLDQQIKLKQFCQVKNINEVVFASLQ